MQMEGVEPKQLSTLHGELIAFEWIEQNTGQAFSVKEGTLSACYRITLNGLREFRRFHGVEARRRVLKRLRSRNRDFPGRRNKRPYHPKPSRLRLRRIRS
jgi:hypothetical protein